MILGAFCAHLSGKALWLKKQAEIKNASRSHRRAQTGSANAQSHSRAG
jgi:hypothetical protein